MPNSFYILTDLFHLENMSNGHSWFDLTLILSFAWNGIIFGILSIRKMEMLLKKAKGNLVSGFIICAVMWLNAFGVYIGRFLRFNSWDILFKPVKFYHGIGHWASDPLSNPTSLAFPMLFATFLFITYVMLYALTHLPRTQHMATPFEPNAEA